MKVDALNRRRRDAKPQPRDTRIDLEPADYAILAALSRHGLLHTEYLFEFRKRFHPNETNHRKRLTKLFNGYCEHPEHRKRDVELDEKGNEKWTHECEAISYLTRDPEQEENRYYGKGNSLVYGLNSRAMLALAEAGLSPRYLLRRSNSFGHDFGLGCITASFELTARNFRYREQLLDHPNCPDATKGEGEPFYLEAAGELIYPDDIFGNEYGERSTRFFALEFDRANKPARGSSTNAIEHTLRNYERALSVAAYRRLGLPNITILFATTKASKMIALQRAAREVVSAPYHPQFLFKTFPMFDRPWQTPKEVLDVWTGWEDPNGVVHDISKKAP